MDETQTRDHINEHADAVVRKDMDAIEADFSEELRPSASQIVNEVLPQPVTGAEVLSIDIGDSEAVALICYSGDGELTVRSRWQEEGGRPVIVHAEPAG